MPHRKESHPPNRIREFRLARGLSLQEVADALALSVSTVQRYEMSERPLTTRHLHAFAEKLDCATADLLSQPRRGADDQEQRLLELWRRMTADQRDNCLQMIALWAVSPAPARKHRRQRSAPPTASHH